MTTNNETIKKNEAVKEFLAEFLEKLEIERKITLHREKILKKKNKMNRLAREIVHLESINLGMQSIKNIKFESVDNIDSVKKLKKAELFFSKTYFKFLENFKFSYCTSKISPDFLTYADIEIQLDAFDRKALDLLHRGCSLEGKEASWVIINLRNLNEWYFIDKKIEADFYKSRALELIRHAQPILDHSVYEKILGNLIVLILTVGTAFVYNKAVNGHFLFFQKTDSAKQLDTISQTVAAVKYLSP